ncbi:AAA family ATPase [Bacteroides nordii]|uniref:nSTAND1 domain-containing NTPase n=1 Tax=Bacteroides nordii TaxID=291645 RepID=UPI002A7FA335|nr:AAA family ATPase [Bacteroides nordii]
MCEAEEIFYEDERRLKESGVRNVFTPHTPINQENLFRGRMVEVQQILSTLNTPGQHVLLFGDRGVGKSSLANVTSSKLIKIAGKELVIKRCSKSDSFSSIFEDVLVKCGVDMSIQTKNRSGNLSVNGIGYQECTERKGFFDKAKSPSWVCDKVKDFNILLLVDEFDSIQDKDDKHKVAEVIKLLSDSNSLFKIFVVGIAESAEELTAGHPSVQRCLKEIKLSKMSNRELVDIINSGSAKLKLNFKRDAKFRICGLSSGYPHFTHLIALKAAEMAIINEIVDIDIEQINEAIEKSIIDCENSLRQSYEETVKSSSTMAIYRKVLYATALCYDEFIRSKDIRFIYKLIFEEEITQQRLNQYLSKLVSNSNDKILKRLTKGVYRFADPRMSSYIRLVQSDMYSDKEENIYANRRVELI